MEKDEVRDVAVGILTALEARVRIDRDAPAPDELTLMRARRHAQELERVRCRLVVGVARLVPDFDAHRNGRL